MTDVGGNFWTLDVAHEALLIDYTSDGPDILQIFEGLGGAGPVVCEIGAYPNLKLVVTPAGTCNNVIPTSVVLNLIDVTTPTAPVVGPPFTITGGTFVYFQGMVCANSNGIFFAGHEADICDQFDYDPTTLVITDPSHSVSVASGPVFSLSDSLLCFASSGSEGVATAAIVGGVLQTPTTTTLSSGIIGGVLRVPSAVSADASTLVFTPFIDTTSTFFDNTWHTVQYDGTFTTSTPIGVEFPPDIRLYNWSASGVNDTFYTFIDTATGATADLPTLYEMQISAGVVSITDSWIVPAQVRDGEGGSGLLLGDVGNVVGAIDPQPVVGGVLIEALPTGGGFAQFINPRLTLLEFASHTLTDLGTRGIPLFADEPMGPNGDYSPAIVRDYDAFSPPSPTGVTDLMPPASFVQWGDYAGIICFVGPSFLNLVNIIIGGGTGTEMNGIAATGLVAFVCDLSLKPFVAAPINGSFFSFATGGQWSIGAILGNVPASSQIL